MTNKDIQKLIVLPKKIYKKYPKKGYRKEYQHKRCNLTLSGGKNNDINFTVFIRQSQVFLENFSIGLNCKILNRVKFLPLIRYNGPHGSKRSNKDHYSKPHIHRISLEDIQLGNEKPPLRNIHITNKYNSIFEEGLKVFLIDTQIINWKDYFPELEQKRLF